MPGRIIAIGDIHGCAAALRTLVEATNPRANDTLITLGDCVDRGLQSSQVIEQLLALRETCRLVPLLGNHEEMMLNFVDGRPQPDDWFECGGAETVESYRDADGKFFPVPPEHVDFIRTWGDCFETDTHFFVHANYEAERPLAQQHWQTMRWQSLKFGIPDPHESGKIAVVGHTSLKNGEILDLGYLVCIDTYCWGGGWLTALDADSGQTWQADRDGRLRQP
ncbi:MAG: serine/threonine protein phosphatase [Planctomycetes bacterium]|nr:serine/threonine protein phosphatase [Planctomycetota bacterium]